MVRLDRSRCPGAYLQTRLTSRSADTEDDGGASGGADGSSAPRTGTVSARTRPAGSQKRRGMRFLLKDTPAYASRGAGPSAHYRRSIIVARERVSLPLQAIDESAL